MMHIIAVTVPLDIEKCTMQRRCAMWKKNATIVGSDPDSLYFKIVSRPGHAHFSMFCSLEKLMRGPGMRCHGDVICGLPVFQRATLKTGSGLGTRLGNRHISAINLA